VVVGFGERGEGAAVGRGEGGFSGVVVVVVVEYEVFHLVWRRGQRVVINCVVLGAHHCGYENRDGACRNRKQAR